MKIRNGSSAVIVDAIRTPVGKYGGTLKDIRPDDLSAFVLKKLIERTAIDEKLIEDVLWGCANQAGEDNRNVGRMAVLLAGLTHNIPAATINRLCGSSLDAINQAARAIWCGDYTVVIAGGVESMSRAPYVIPKNVSGKALFGSLTAYDTALGWRFPNPEMERLFPLESMGETAENIYEKWKIRREEQDAFALRSHQLALAAQRDGRFADEIVSVAIDRKNGNKIIDLVPPSAKTSSVLSETVGLAKSDSVEILTSDEGPRADTSLEKLTKLRPAFRKNGSVTAGNSSGLNDGASALLLMSAEKAKELGYHPLVRIISTGVAGVDPRYMGIGPVPASHMALNKAELSLKDIDLIELNEAFAVQSLAVLSELGANRDIVNVNGGAIALGHPLGCSGARIMTTLVHEMKRRQTRYGLATMCIGVGQGISTIVELAE
jgi:acetyl-CoA acetyltransferase family protein